MKQAAVCLLGLVTVSACSPDSAATGGQTASVGGGGNVAAGGEAGTSTSSGTAGSNQGGAGNASSGTGGNAASGGNGGFSSDACELATPSCDVAPPSASGQGLVALDRCAFALDRSPTFESLSGYIDALEAVAAPVSLGTVLADLNRTPVVASAAPGNPPGLEYAFRWENSENDKPTWVPQGITGSPDADASGLVLGRKLWLVSFYFDEDVDPALPPKGVRLALVDVTDPAQPRYRFILLVEPEAGANFKPVSIHAGGIAWFGDYVYVADTSGGLRVFDVGRMLQVSTAEDSVGCDGTSCQAGLYKYVLPQVGSYARFSVCEEQPRFSFVALDRSATPPQLVTGEYCSNSACSGPLAGRLLQWPLDEATGLLAETSRTFSKGAFFAGERQIQGGVSHEGAFFLSSSEPAGAGGALFRVDPAGSTSYGWIDTPEDVMIDTANPSAPKIVSLSEGLGERYVFQAALGAYLP